MDNKAGFWGRVIFYVDDVDKIYHHMTAVGLTPEFRPRDATWGERYFHITDPDGHELSFARPFDRTNHLWPQKRLADTPNYVDKKFNPWLENLKYADTRN